jgi:uncharacterized protein with HEPN domain
MAADAAKYVWDAIAAAEAAQKFASGKSLDAYIADHLLRSAIERQLEIFGEALNRLRQVDPTTAAAITHLPRAVALRNILVHAYADVDPLIVWGVVDSHLNDMLAQLRVLGSDGPR